MKKQYLVSFLMVLMISFYACSGGNGSDNSGQNQTTNGESIENASNKSDADSKNGSSNLGTTENDGVSHDMGSELQGKEKKEGLFGNYILADHKDHEISAGTKMYFDGKNKVSFEGDKYTTYKVKGNMVHVDMKSYSLVFKMNGDTLSLVDTVGTLKYIKSQE